MRKLDLQTIFLAGTVLFGIAAGCYIWMSHANGQAPEGNRVSTLTLERIPFDGQQAYEYLKAICALGPRPSGSVGMQRQQELLTQHFQGLGGLVERQTFTVRHPEDGSAVDMTNLIVRWHPDRPKRILLCAHYDTRPFPDRDPDRRKRKGIFLGANDGASGVALLMELGAHMPQLKSEYGIDFVFFDGEEFVFSEGPLRRDPYFLGSTYFAQEYANNPPPILYRYGVLLDMVADRNLEIYQERHSMSWADTRPLVEDIWQTAEDLGVREFIPRVRHTVNDDHVPLHDIAGIAICDVIDFDYPSTNRRTSYWHTTMDVPAACSALSLAKVGWVIQTWLEKLGD